ncbi:PAS/PAC sensor hybrid histidine kinase [Pseudodesulfovibrio mercurii]|uniref:histidine kinase n=1 Tax=Pseudodesulfovibrio mercurii TaxID=641491 RepID=F0JBF5_9BACT|nr:GAF domain-containing protein [Pseudodesulfovibrio mercurii]EGB14274.1 PAS/PAC sensor hybrid histidine kinase [Pseudodesulfovibrio mercurii]
MTRAALLRNILKLQEPEAALACRTEGGPPGEARIIEANEAASALLGLSREELLDRTPGEVITNFAALAGDAPAFETGSQRIEHTLCGKGRATPVEIRSHGLDLDGDPLFVLILRDITVRRRREMKNDLDEQRFKTLYSLSRMINRPEEHILDYALVQSVYMTDSRMGYIGFLDETESRLLLRPWTVPGLGECTVKDRSRVFAIEGAGLWAEAVRQRRPIITNDYASAPNRRGTPEGHVPLVRHMNVPVMDNNRIRMLVGVANKDEDYTESDVVQLSLIMEGVWHIIQRKRMEADLIRAMREARQADRAKSQFLANMSHELRTPLNGIMGMTQLLLGSGGLTEEQREYLSLSLESSINLSGVLTSLLDLSSIESGGTGLTRTDFDLPDVIRSAVTPQLPQAELKGLQLACRLDGSVPARAHGDGEKLRQIIVNLVHNGVKFTQEGLVTVTASCAPREDVPDGITLSVSVADTGVGIPEDKREAVFESFMLGEEYMTKRYSGLGLGLTISRKLAELMGGTLELEHHTGKGSVFTLKVPLLRRTNWTEFPAPDETTDPKLNILVAEDEEINALATSRLLRTQGHAAIVVDNGQRAIDALMRGGFDMVLMDVQMPVINGLEVTEIIRSGAAEGIDAGIPIIGLTAFADEGDRARFLDAGMDDVVTKPFDAHRLLDAVRLVARTRGRV